MTLTKSDSIALLSAALVKAQSQMEAAKKKSTNPFHKSKYANLEEVIDTIKEPLILMAYLSCNLSLRMNAEL